MTSRKVMIQKLWSCSCDQLISASEAIRRMMSESRSFVCVMGKVYGKRKFYDVNFISFKLQNKRSSLSGPINSKDSPKS